ncbi:MAG: hypothetical protein GY757_06785 [bacterium]|nr:hypothetical protein [bacterium]
MLSKIVSSDNVQTLDIQPFVIPSEFEVEQIIDDKKREAKRRKIVDSNKDDPIQAAKKEANLILLEADKKIKDAELEAETIKIRKEKEIRAQLEQEYMVKMEKELKSLRQNYIESLETLAKLKKILFMQSEKEFMELIFSIARKVVGDEIETSPQVVMQMLEKGFERLKDANEFEIKVHPLDYDVLLKDKEILKDIISTSGTVKFTKDESVERGGCRIVTESGEISSEPGTQLDIIIKELANGT